MCEVFEFICELASEIVCKLNIKKKNKVKLAKEELQKESDIGMEGF